MYSSGKESIPPLRGRSWGSVGFNEYFEAPAATDITTLGIDHVTVLGNTIEQIAWHKSGIVKANCPAFTVE